MKHSKIICSFIAWLLILPCFSQALPKTNPRNIFSKILYTPSLTAKRQSQQLKYTPVILDNSSKGRWNQSRGDFLEDISNIIYSNHMTNKYTQVNAKYGGGNRKGLDGLYVEVDKLNQIRNVRVIEVKSGWSSLQLVGQDNIPQLSTEWVIEGINKAIYKRTYELGKTSNSIQKQELEQQIKYLNKSLERVKMGYYDRYLVTTRVINGEFTINQQKVIKELDWKNIAPENRNPYNILEFSDEKTIRSFSLLKNQIDKLDPFEKKIRKTFYKELDKALAKVGLPKKDIDHYIYNLETDSNFDLIRLKSNVDESTKVASLIDEVSNKSLIKAQNSFKYKNTAIKSGMALISVISEIQTISDYNNGYISNTDLIFYTSDNLLSMGAVFIKQLNPISNIVFAVGQVVRNLLDYKNAKNNEFYTTVNILTGVGGFAIGSLLATAVGKGLAAAFTTPSHPVVQAIIGVASIVTFLTVNYIINYKLRTFILNKYEQLKEPKNFQEACNYVKYNYPALKA